MTGQLTQARAKLILTPKKHETNESRDNEDYRCRAERKGSCALSAAGTATAAASESLVLRFKNRSVRLLLKYHSKSAFV